MLIGILLLIVSYLIGSIPFGLLIGKAAGKDIRQSGSGNIGSTNVVRTLGFKLGLLSAVCDITKGTIIILLIFILEASGIWFNPFVIGGDSLYILYGFAAVLGHCYSIYLKFTGGKAVATSLGVLFLTVPFSGVIALVCFTVVMLITGIVSLGSTFATISALISAFIIYGIFENNIYTCIVLVAFALLIIIKHIPNYKRIIAGTESSFKKRKNVAK